MKLFLKTNDVKELEAVRKTATNRLLLGVITETADRNRLEALSDVARNCVVPIASLDPAAIISQSASLKEFKANIVPAITFAKSTLQAINWLAEQGYESFVNGVHNGIQASFAAQVGARYVAASSEELLEPVLEAVDYYGGGVDVPYGNSWSTEVVRTNVAGMGDIFDAVDQGARVCVVSPKLFWEMIDSTAIQEPEQLLCEDNEKADTHQSTRNQT